MRMCRMATAAIARKCARSRGPAFAWSTSLRYASLTSAVVPSVPLCTPTRRPRARCRRAIRRSSSYVSATRLSSDSGRESRSAASASVFADAVLSGLTPYRRRVGIRRSTSCQELKPVGGTAGGRWRGASSAPNMPRRRPAGQWRFPRRNARGSRRERSHVHPRDGAGSASGDGHRVVWRRRAPADRAAAYDRLARCDCREPRERRVALR